MTRLIGDLGYQAKSSCHLNPSDFAELSSSDMIFLDMMLPNTDGIQVLEVLSRHQIKPSIVLMSGVHGDVLAAAETIGKRLGLRILGALTKPFRTTDIRPFLETEQHQPGQVLKQPLASEINIEDVVAGLERCEFDAFLQPIMDLTTNQPLGYEALARWQSEKFSLVTPDRFIAVAARHGILPRLTHQILDRALEELLVLIIKALDLLLAYLDLFSQGGDRLLDEIALADDLPKLRFIPEAGLLQGLGKGFLGFKAHPGRLELALDRLLGHLEAAALRLVEEGELEGEVVEELGPQALELGQDLRRHHLALLGEHRGDGDLKARFKVA
jgi:FixJ family two-component response regulator